MEKELLLVNIYGPNQDSPSFYQSLTETIKKFNNNNVIIVGDWNLVLDQELDCYNYKHINNPKAKEKVDWMILELGLTDIWREGNPQCKRYTWRKPTPLKQSRLDFFLISDYLMWNFKDAEILPGYRSDHSLITLKLESGKDIKRKTFWKFNCSLLKDKTYVDEINEEIKRILEECAADHYNRSTLHEISKDKIELSIPDKVFLDFLLMKIRSRTISFASMKKKKTIEKETKLEQDIHEIERQQIKTTEDIKTLNEINQELITLREKKMEGVLLRSKARWVADGEKITKYFCSLEKRNFISKSMTKLNDKNGTVVDDTDEIKNEVKNFYEKLYQSKDLEKCEIKDLVDNIPKLSPKEAKSLEGDISLEEAGFALKNMKNEKSPGTDGFGAEFFKFFWKQIGVFVVRALNESFKDGQLSSTQKEGIITCIPKGDKDKEYLKNWRPISLLNVVYKIGSSCIANRIKGVLPNLVNEDQTGFVSKRFIGDNIRLIYDMIDYLNSNNLPGMLICIDFEKAFDSLDWNFMYRVLKAYGFSNGICRWIETFYCDIKATVIVNGQTTQWFPVERGCRQGDPVSPYLFILCAEILGIMIRENKNIEGITINQTEHKISQFADDTQLMNQGDRKSFENSILTIGRYGKASGLFMNADKTQAIMLGSRRKQGTKYMPHLKITWNPAKFKILGIWFTQDLQECEKLNYDEKLAEIKTLFKIWMKRLITPLGRVAVLKSLIVSKLVYLWILLPNPPELWINKFQKLCFQFVWNKKQDRIARKISMKEVKSGGLGIPDLHTYIASLKIMWIRKLRTSSHKWITIAKSNFPFLNNLQCYGPNYVCIRAKNKTFWLQVYDAYKKLFYKVNPKSTAALLAEPVFYNENIKLGNKIISYQNWIDKGAWCIGHFFNENGQSLTYPEFKNRYSIASNFLTYSGLIQSIKRYLKHYKMHIIDNITSDTHASLTLIYSIHKGTKLYYNTLSENSSEAKCCKKWTRHFNREMNWKTCFLKLHKINDVKLKWLQLRIIHRILGTNVILKKMRITNSEQCTFCKQERDSIAHLFWHCSHVQTFWKELEKVINERCEIACNIKLNECLVLMGMDRGISTDDVFDLIILLGKQYIYSCKMQKCCPNITTFMKRIVQRYKLEQHNSKIKQEEHKFKNAWHHYAPVLFPN